MSSGPTSGVKYNRAAFPKSATGTAVTRLTTKAPFASTLRPNLTGGALPRSAGGYSLGGSRANGARYFSHTPAAPAQVVNNVSTAVRGFWLSGHKAQFDGVTVEGDKKYRRVSTLQDKAAQKMRSLSRNAPGSFIEFNISPTLTALSPLGVTFPFGSTMHQSTSLNTEGFMDVLSVDFSRSLKDFAAIMSDLKRLSSLGDLPITLEDRSKIRIRFPGCDAETVERLCDEVGVQRGIILEDADFDHSVGAEVALIFPFASTTSQYPLSSPGGSLRCGQGFEEIDENPWAEPEGYESMDDVNEHAADYFTKPSDLHISTSTGYEGLEGIYRFLEQCDNSKRI